jgi:hypothetical protein
MSRADIVRVQGDFAAAGKRALAAGFEWLVIAERNRFMPWFIGLAIIAVADGVLLLLTDEGKAELAQQAALVAIPVVGLAIMFLMFKSQK